MAQLSPCASTASPPTYSGFPAETQPHRTWDFTNSKYTFIGVREMKGNSQQGKNLQVLKTTSLEIKLN